MDQKEPEKAVRALAVRWLSRNAILVDARPSRIRTTMKICTRAVPERLERRTADWFGFCCQREYEEVLVFPYVLSRRSQVFQKKQDMAEACGSQTQTLDSQLTANDDVPASAKFQLESIGVRKVFSSFRA